MRVANVDGRLAIVADGFTVDVETASDGRFGPDVAAVYDDWTEFKAWASAVDATAGEPLDPDRLGPPSPRPQQIFGIGLNYRGHAAETGKPIPEVPMVFTKFVSALGGPRGAVAVATERVDWEVELAVVIGPLAHRVDEADAWTHVAGLTAAQDFSARDVQMRPAEQPQFSLGKSFPGFAPLGPVLVTPDEFDDPNDIALGCTVNGEQVQSGRTSDLIFSVPALIEYLSSIVVLLPGDVIFTGTPSGVGVSRTPPRFLAAGDEVVTTIAGIGELRHTMVADPR